MSNSNKSNLQVIDLDNDEEPQQLDFYMVQTLQTEYFYIDSNDGSIFSLAEMNAFQNNMYDMEIRVTDRSFPASTDVSATKVQVFLFDSNVHSLVQRPDKNLMIPRKQCLLTKYLWQPI